MLARLSGTGFTAGLAALLLWPVYASYEGAWRWPFAAAAAVAGLCGAAILLVTLFDMLFHRRRGERIRPVRAFDVFLGVALVALGLLQWAELAGRAPYTPG